MRANVLPVALLAGIFALVLTKHKKKGPVIPNPIPPGGKVVDKLTPLSVSDAQIALKDAYYAATGESITAKALAMGLAQTALETGRWKSIHWYNFGNITAGSKYESAWTDYSGDYGHHYRAYSSAFNGAFDFWRLLVTHYALALAEYLNGNPVAVAARLKERGYYEAPLATYSKTLSSLYNEYSSKVPTFRLEPNPSSVLRELGQEFVDKLWVMCRDNKWNADAIVSVMQHESGLNPAAKNPAKGQSASGLLQIIESTAKELGTSTADILNMSAVQQLEVVEKYYKLYFSRLSVPKTRVGYYTLNWGIGIVDKLDYVLASKSDPKTSKLYDLNSALDSNHDGRITVGDLDSLLAKVYATASGDRISVSGSVVS